MTLRDQLIARLLLAQAEGRILQGTAHHVPRAVTQWHATPHSNSTRMEYHLWRVMSPQEQRRQQEINRVRSMAQE